MNGEGVSYTVKELIAMLETSISGQVAGIERKLDQIGERLDRKADQARVDGLEQRISRHDEKIAALEFRSAGQVALSSWQRWAFGTLGVGVLSAIATLVWLASGGH